MLVSFFSNYLYQPPPKIQNPQIPLNKNRVPSPRALSVLISTLTRSMSSIARRAPHSSKPSLLRQFLKLQHSVGNSALMLSGGGSITMYHLGTIKSLIQSGVYGRIPVVSGTSGGSIAAAMVAIKTPEELLRDVCVPNVSTDFMRTGEQRRRNIRWFPEMFNMGMNWVKEGVLVKSEDFRECCYFYYGEATFEEGSFFHCFCFCFCFCFLFRSLFAAFSCPFLLLRLSSFSHAVKNAACVSLSLSLTPTLAPPFPFSVLQDEEARLHNRFGFSSASR